MNFGAGPAIVPGTRVALRAGNGERSRRPERGRPPPRGAAQPPALPPRHPQSGIGIEGLRGCGVFLLGADTLRAGSHGRGHGDTRATGPLLPASLKGWLSPLTPQPDGSSGAGLTTEAAQEPLSNPSMEKGTEAAADCSWWPASS